MTNQLLAELEILQQAKDKLQNDYQNAVDKINKLQQENKQLKEKIDNVIKYCKREIKNIFVNFEYADIQDLENILEILGDKE